MCCELRLLLDVDRFTSEGYHVAVDQILSHLVKSVWLPLAITLMNLASRVIDLLL